MKVGGVDVDVTEQATEENEEAHRVPAERG